MAGAGERKGKKDDNGIGTAIDFVLSNARLVLGVGGAAMLGIATLAVKRMYDRAISAPTSPTRLSHSGKRSWEEPNWMGSPRLLNRDMKTGLSRSLQTLPTEPSAFEIGEEGWYPSPPQTTSGHQCYSCIAQTFFKYGCVRLFKPFPFVPSPPFWG
uniref:Mitochondrial dynamics protein MID51 n=1 Tax=Castor canadensis TaxID=51338 RepID=A0A8C0W1B7_CASCN